MKELRGAGHVIGEYVGERRADMEQEDEDLDEHSRESIDSGVEPAFDDIQEEEGDDVTQNAHPLLLLFDTETTGLNIYEDHIVEIAGKVTGVPLSAVTYPTYSRLVHTPRNIPSKGKYAGRKGIYLLTMFHILNSY